MNITKPTCAQICNEELEFKHREIDDSWRHGVRRMDVYFRKQDSTYWLVEYRVSTDGETNELREGFATITQAESFEKTVISYREIP